MASDNKDYNESNAEVARMLDYVSHGKGRERSNRAAGLHDLAMGSRRRCPMRHEKIAWSGPPHDPIQAYVCVDCHAAACEPEIKDRGMTFDSVPDFIIHAIMDDDLQRQATTNPVSYGGLGGIV